MERGNNAASKTRDNNTTSGRRHANTGCQQPSAHEPRRNDPEQEKEMAKQARTIYTADHKNDPACSAAAKDIHGGYYGPWKELGHSEL